MYPSGRLKRGLPAGPIRGTGRKAQKQVPEHVEFFVAVRAAPSHAGNLAREFDVAGNTFEHVGAFARPQVRVDVPDLLGGLSASSALNLRGSGIEEILIQIHKLLAAARVRALDRLTSVIKLAFFLFGNTFFPLAAGFRNAWHSYIFTFPSGTMVPVF